MFISRYCSPKLCYDCDIIACWCCYTVHSGLVTPKFGELDRFIFVSFLNSVVTLLSAHKIFCSLLYKIKVRILNSGLRLRVLNPQIYIGVGC